MLIPTVAFTSEERTIFLSRRIKVIKRKLPSTFWCCVWHSCGSPVSCSSVSYPECLPKRDMLRRIIGKTTDCVFPSVGFLKLSTISVWVFQSDTTSVAFCFMNLFTFPWTRRDIERSLHTAVWRITLLLLVWTCYILASLALPDSCIGRDDV